MEEASLGSQPTSPARARPVENQPPLTAYHDPMTITADSPTAHHADISTTASPPHHTPDAPESPHTAQEPQTRACAHPSPAEAVERLSALPLLAQLADQPDTTPASRHTRALPGSRIPPGTQDVIAELDRGREQPDQLARLTRCVRAVWEEHDLSTLPDLTHELQVTWHTETTWLATTLPLWWADPWCREWITSETLTGHDDGTRSIQHTLKQRAATRTPAATPTCPTCGTQLTATITQHSTLAIAECPKCDRVLGMRMLTTPAEAARREQAAEQRKRAAIIAGARRMLGLT